MILQRIKAKNYRTYLDLDLDLEVDADRPLVLIGGANGGGKTTLFNAITGALYGLRINDVETFRREVNAGASATGHAEEVIELEVWFSGQVLSQQVVSRLTRTWTLVDQKSVRWSVKLNMGGNVIQYGAATPDRERLVSEGQVNKVIKANLPRELSQYFLFDAMTAGEKLSEDQLGQVIKENIESVMGLRKYSDLSQAARSVEEARNSEHLKATKDRDEYLALIEAQRDQERTIAERVDTRNKLLAEQASLQAIVQDLRTEHNKDDSYKAKIGEVERQKKATSEKEYRYRSQLEEFSKIITPSVGLPMAAFKLRSEIEALLVKWAEKNRQTTETWDRETARRFLQQVWTVLEQKSIDLTGIELDDIVDALAKYKGKEADGILGSLEAAEVQALRSLIQESRANAFPAMDVLRTELIQEIEHLPFLDDQIKLYTSVMAGKDYSILERSDLLDRSVNQLDGDIRQMTQAQEEIRRKLQRFDVASLEEPDPKLVLAQKLKLWFEEAADVLLKTKKTQIEQSMKKDLNANLAAYRDCIDRVELSENLKTLSFRIFHTAGNEIYLGQLNTGSKQVVIQVLLKALHESGDYDPPVMIDTVMGVLDKESRATILQNYFPVLSHQTILLSTDSEIDPASDYPVIQEYLSKAYTLVRDRQAQKTMVQTGYFGKGGAS